MSDNPYSAPEARLAEAPSRRGMESNIKAFRAHRAISWLYAACALLITATMAMSRATPAPGAIYSLVIVMLGFFALHHFTARGAKNRKGWARVVSLIMGFLFLFAFPIGTLIGAYLISTSWTEWREPRIYGPSLADGWPK